MKKLIASAAAAAVAAGALAGTSFGAGTKTVQVKDNRFSPTTLTVSRGTTVKWVWKGHAAHNVVSSGAASFKSKTQLRGSFSKRLTRKGTYRIVCQIHSPGMKMTIKVK
jgi:plastocyanin